MIQEPLHSHNNSIHNGQCNDELKAIRIASATALKAKRQEEKLLELS